MLCDTYTETNKTQTVWSRIQKRRETKSFFLTLCNGKEMLLSQMGQLYL